MSTALVVPGTLRDSMYILESLLEQPTSLKPVEIMTDTASYSDLVFGLFKLLGYQFSPQLTDIGERRFWRLDRTADYGAFNSLSRHVIKVELIERHWDGVTAYCRPENKVPLGFVEGLNNKI